MRRGATNREDEGIRRRGPGGAALGLVATAVALGGCASAWALHERAIEHNRVGIERLREGDLDGAAAAFRLALEYNRRFSEPYGNLALVAMRRGDLDDADELLRRALLLNPDFAEAWTNLGCLRLRRGDPEGAVDALREAIRCDPGQLDARYDLIRALAEAGRLDEAWEQVLRLDVASPEDPKVRGLAAVVALRRGRWGEAVAWADRALAAAPDEPLASFARGMALVRERRTAEAEPYLRVAAIADVGPEAWEAYGVACLDLGRWSDARAALERVLAEHPDRVAAGIGAGTAAAALGDPAAAAVHLRRVLAVGEAHPERLAPRARAAVEALLGGLAAVDSVSRAE